MELNCVFSIEEGDDESYTCTVNSASITKRNTAIKSIQGTHMEGKSNDDVTTICFDEGNIIKYFPRGLHNIFPGLNRLEIENCGLKSISRTDLVGLEKLEELHLDGNLLTSLLNDLFEDMHNLMRVSFYKNKLKRLSSKLLEPLLANEVEYVGFQNNTKIDSFYTQEDDDDESTNSIEELMDIIDRKCGSPTWRQTVETANEEMWTSGHLSDFTIIAGEQNFNVHKIELAKHSSVFMAMFMKYNKETRDGEMIIKDFSSEVVAEFLCYIYTGEIPDATNAMDLFAIAVMYDVSGLKEACEQMILENLNVSNAVDVLAFGNLYRSENMKALAFVEVKKMFPGRIIHDKIMNKPERLKKLVDTHREFEELLSEMIEN